MQKSVSRTAIRKNRRLAARMVVSALTGGLLFLALAGEALAERLDTSLLPFQAAVFDEPALDQTDADQDEPEPSALAQRDADPADPDQASTAPDAEDAADQTDGDTANGTEIAAETDSPEGDQAAETDAP